MAYILVTKRKFSSLSFTWQIGILLANPLAYVTCHHKQIQFRYFTPKEKRFTFANKYSETYVNIQNTKGFLQKDGYFNVFRLVDNEFFIQRTQTVTVCTIYQNIF